MGFITNDIKNNSATTIWSWYTDAIATVQALKSSRDGLVNQLELMKVNKEYSIDDCNEVQELIDDLNKRIKEI